jgi:hypothetical protein
VVVGRSHERAKTTLYYSKKYHQIAPPAHHEKQQQCPNIWHLLHTAECSLNRAVTQGHHLFYLKQFVLASDNTTTIFVSKSLQASLWKGKEGLA